jgi:hypothetical protein
MIIYRKSDRIKIKLLDLTVELAPLSYHEKSEIQETIINDAMGGSIKALKNAVKDIKGLKLPDGSDYKLEFDGDSLSDECVDGLMNIKGITELNIACLDLLNGVPEDEFINPLTGQKLEGIEIVKEERENSPEKKSGS